MAPRTERSVQLRLAAAAVVADVVASGRSLDSALNAHLAGWDGRDYALGAEIAQGSVRWYHQLRAVLGRLQTRGGARMAAALEALLVTGLYQIHYLRVPDHAAVSQTVAAVGASREKRARGFANAVLRRFLREGPALLENLPLAARFSHPDWLLAKIRTDWPDAATAILDANNERAPQWLRVNPAHGSVADYRERLAADCPQAKPAALAALPTALKLDAPVSVAELPGFDTGVVSVQDGGAQLAAWLLGSAPGERVLDACAAPGNKSAHLIENAAGDIQLTALDIDSTRLAMLRHNLDRLGIDAQTLTADAAQTDSWWDGKAFDRILIDAPCTASGVIRRHPDIKFTRRPGDLDRLNAIQARLLESLWPTLKPGGKLVYATCSVLSDENERIVQAFVDTKPGARVCKRLPNAAIQALMQPRGPGFQVLPGEQGLDGFFYACLDKST